MERKRPKPPSPVNTQLEEPSVPKHAKLVLKPPKFITSKLKQGSLPTISTLLEDIMQLETAEEVLEHLLGILDSCKLESLLERQGALSSEQVSKCISTIGKLAKTYREDVCVCCMLVHVVEVFGMKLKSISEGLLPKNFQLFVLSLVDHDNADVKVAVLKCLSKMVVQYTDKTTFIEQVLELAQNTIHNTHHGVRVECLKLIGQLCYVTSSACETPLACLEDHCVDSDPRVRSAAFQALYQVHSKDSEILPLSVYFKASDSLSDKSSEVRSKAVKLVWALGLRYANKVVPLRQESSVELRLLDDAFIKICDLVNDSSMPVRALAAQLLGDFHSVDGKFLEQTLDKKLMSHLKVIKSDHQRQRELHQGGGASMDWDSGIKWGSSVPKMVVDPGEMSLMSAGACGAFVHGLEDEFMEVRSAAVGSMCQLGMHCRRFAAQSLDYLVDMFNDEIEDVRLKAISSLCQISSILELREDQLETVLAILEESASVIRDALRDLLSTCRITTSAGLNTTVHALLDNLKKYPHDYRSIWSCLRNLGSNHGYLVSSLVPELLSTHSFFMGKEPDMDDPAYICILILVFNAAACCPTIPPLFPSHVFRHYTYLRDTLPHLIPSITTGMPSALKTTHSRRQQAPSGTRFLEQVLTRAQRSCTLPSSRGGHSTLLTCVTDLLKMADLNKDVTGMAKVAATFLQCQLLISKVQGLLSQDVLLTSDTSSHHSLPTITSSIRELLLLSYRVEHVFTGLSPTLTLKCHMIRMSAHAMALILAVHLDFDTEHSSIFVKLKLGFMERLQKLKFFCQKHDLSVPALAMPLLELNFATVATETLTDSLQPLTSSQFCLELPLRDMLSARECVAELLEPQNSSREDYIRFVSSLALSVHVDATLKNVDDPASVAILVKFPDERQLLFPVKPSEVRSTGPAESRLDTAVILSHGLWTDPCQVEFCVVKRFSSDIAEGNCLPFNAAHKTTPKPTSSRTAKTGGVRVVEGGCGRVGIPAFPAVGNPVHSQRQDSLERPGLECVLAISKVVRVNVHPQEKLNNTFNAF